MTTDEVDRDLSKQREISDGVAVSNAAAIFVEGHVAHSVQAVLDLPMPTDGFRQDVRRLPTAGEEVANCVVDRVGPVDAADGLHGQSALENRLHWVLDVVFHDDLARLRTGSGPQNIAVVEHMAMNLVRAQTDKHSLKLRRKLANLNPDYLETLVKNPSANR